MNKNVVVNAFISQNNIKIIATAKLNNHIMNIHEESISKNNNFENRNEIKNYSEEVCLILTKTDKVSDDIISEVFENISVIINNSLSGNSQSFTGI